MHLLGKPAATFSDAALGEHATDFAAKVDASTLDIDQVVGASLNEKSGKWRAEMRYKKKTRQLGSQTADLAEAIRRREGLGALPRQEPEGLRRREDGARRWRWQEAQARRRRQS